MYKQVYVLNVCLPWKAFGHMLLRVEGALENDRYHRELFLDFPLNLPPFETVLSAILEILVGVPQQFVIATVGADANIVARAFVLHRSYDMSGVRGANGPSNDVDCAIPGVPIVLVIVLQGCRRQMLRDWMILEAPRALLQNRFREANRLEPGGAHLHPRSGQHLAVTIVLVSDNLVGHESAAFCCAFGDKNASDLLLARYNLVLVRLVLLAQLTHFITSVLREHFSHLVSYHDNLEQQFATMLRANTACIDCRSTIAYDCVYLVNATFECR